MGRAVRPLFRKGLVLALILALIAPLTFTPHRAGAALFGSFGIKDEVELGRKFEVLVRSRLPLVEDPEVKLYVQSIVNRLSSVIPPQPFPFQAHVMLHHSLNAFAVPGGNVFVHTGLIIALEHESELAGVLAHELAHVTQRHVASRIERSQVITVGSLLGALAGAFLGGGQGGTALSAASLAAGQSAMLNYSRSDETDADQMGFQYLLKAGYRLQGMATAFKKLQRKQWSSGIDIPEYVSTHPDLGRRVTEMTARIEAQPASVQNRKEDDRRFKRVQALVLARYEDPAVAERRFAAMPRNEPLTQMGLGIVASRRNRVHEAGAAFDRALKLASDDALIWREAGRFYYSVGDKRARTALETALKLDSRDVMAQFFYARTLDGAGDKLRAHRYYEEVLRTVPEDIEVHQVYGRSLGEAGKPFEGFVHLTYSAVYENDTRKVRRWLKQARGAARSPADQETLKRLESVIAERSEHWSDKDIVESPSKDRDKEGKDAR